MASNLEEFVRQAKNGDKKALETVVSRIQGMVFGLALRMLGHPEDAEDEAQEILIKVITHLSDFREESAFTSWVYRISCNHLLTTRKRKSERTGVTFEFLEDLILPEAATTCSAAPSEPEQDILRQEAKLGCIQCLLICLEREIRIAFILGEVFGVTGEEGAYILGITPEAFRKRLSRGRERVQAFMLKTCGLINKNNPCRCDKNSGRDLEWSGINPKYLPKKSHRHKMRAEAMAHLKELSDIQRITALFRSYPEYQSPDSFTNIVKELIDSGKYRLFAK